jgi:hypothetical protein
MPEEIATSTGLRVETVHTAVRRLQIGGLVTAGPNGFHPVEGAFKDAVRADQTDRVPLDDDPARDAVLRSFIRDDRITVMPTVPAKLRIVLEYVGQVFEPGRSYPEREVNDILHRWYDDYAQLRRDLVDWGVLKRADGIYQRA